MSLATRCTHCGTIFKVVQDQLKVSEGWVRCGRCHEVFNALPTLFDLEKDPPPPRVTPPAPAPTQTTPPAFGDVAATPAQAEPTATWSAPPPEPTADETTAPATCSDDLLSSNEVNPGDLDSQAPGAWAPTQPNPLQEPPPSHRLTEDDLALDPTPIEATTEFDLDTSIAVDDNTPLEDVIASVTPRSAQPPSAPRPMPVAAFTPVEPPRPWLNEPPQDVPSTDEEDALDSRYLMPSDRERKSLRRRGQGPEFADAEFPSDAMQDAEDDWASDFGPSALDPEPAPPPAAPPLASAPTFAAPPTTGLRATAAALASPSPQAAQQDGADEALPSAPLSDVGDDFSPEQAVEPPSQRKGRAGTRGRDPAQDTPEFVKRAQRKAFWRHPATRAVLSVLALSLLLTLGLQLVHQFRDLVAAYHPAARPLLTQWCDAVGCRLAPPLRLEDLQVESATLVRATSEGPDNYRLAVVLRNQATIDLAWPHVDLTLTDEHGTVIARRMFSPADAQWLDTADPKPDAPGGSASTPSARPPAAAPRQRSTTLQWRLLASDIQPAGYTAELFYP